MKNLHLEEFGPQFELDRKIADILFFIKTMRQNTIQVVLPKYH